MNDNEFDEFFSDEPIEDVKLDIDQIKNNISKYGSQKLCEMIVCDRYFGFEQKLSPVCMEELAKRRTAGDDFDFESYIEQAYKELPEFSLAIPDVRTILNQAIGRKLNHQ